MFCGSGLLTSSFATTIVAIMHVLIVKLEFILLFIMQKFHIFIESELAKLAEEACLIRYSPILYQMKKVNF